MDVEVVVSTIIEPTYLVMPQRFASEKATVMLLAIGLQESRFEHRYQLPLRKGGPKGPARGFWQFERGGGVRGVLEHPATQALARIACMRAGVKPVPMDVWQRLETDDILACTFARLLLWSDPRPLPALGDADAAWSCYIRNWRPGRPHPQTWDSLYRQALAAVA